MGVVVADEWAIPLVVVLLSTILALLSASWRSNAALRVQVELLKQSNATLGRQVDALTAQVARLHDDVVDLTSMARLRGERMGRDRDG